MDSMDLLGHDLSRFSLRVCTARICLEAAHDFSFAFILALLWQLFPGCPWQRSNTSESTLPAEGKALAPNPIFVHFDMRERRTILWVINELHLHSQNRHDCNSTKTFCTYTCFMRRLRAKFVLSQVNSKITKKGDKHAFHPSLGPILLIYLIRNKTKGIKEHFY